MNIFFCNSNDKVYQKMLNKLLKPIFLDFQFWYDLNLWNSNYESYAIIHNNELVSNICVYKAEIVFNDNLYTALSLGAVATHEAYRGRGYARTLMEHILEKYGDTPMYLSANEGVLDFYPRFGFTRVYEKLPVIHANINNDIKPVKLPYDNPKIERYVNTRGNFSRRLDCVNTASVNMFHIHLGYLKDCIYEISQLDCMVIARADGGTLHLIDVIAERIVSFSELSPLLPFQAIQRIECGFMPDKLNVDYCMEPYEADPMFFRGNGCSLGDFKFPELSFT